MSVALWNQSQGQALIDTFIEAGVCHAVVSPGSRNTPLVLAIASRTEHINAHVALDERSAGFLALGLARESGRPTILVCTSGSALAHYLPAVIEANEAGIPLLICSADRPAELHGCGAPQAIHQAEIFSSHVRSFFFAAAPEGEGCAEKTIKVALDAVSATRGQDPGPVHLNLAYREPLWDPKAAPSKAFSGTINRTEAAPTNLCAAEQDRLITSLIQAQRGLIVCGHFEGPHRSDFGSKVRALAAALNWPIIAEPSSGARFGGATDANVICHADSILRTELATTLQPDFILRFGTNPTSKPVYQWLGRQEQATQELVNRRGRWNDPTKRAKTLWIADEGQLCANVVSELTGQDTKSDPSWSKVWAAANQAAQNLIKEHCQGALWEGSVAHHLCNRLPESSVLHVANSMPIRDVDGVTSALPQKVDVYANRGANGIDGTIATFFGEVSARDQGIGTLLIGDLAFLHDASSLQLAKRVRRPATIVVVDNAGGGIFQYLPISGHSGAFENFFTTPQSTDIDALCAAYHVPYTAVDSAAGYDAALGQHLERPGVSVIHVTVDARDSHQRHLALWSAINEALKAGGGA